MTDNEAYFVEDARGVHVCDPMNAEYTACGTSFDCHSTEDDEEAAWGGWREISKRTVTCPDCARVVLAYRGVRVRQS